MLHNEPQESFNFLPAHAERAAQFTNDEKLAFGWCIPLSNL
jgi:hypothetical protein